MGTFILIIIFTAYSKGGITTAEFSSQATCEAAATELSDMSQGTWGQITLVTAKCVKK